MGLDLRKHVESGRVFLSRSIPPSSRPASSRTPAGRPSRSKAAAIVVIDSLNGYLNAMPGERFLIVQLHELLSYLGQAAWPRSCRRAPRAHRQRR
jgi:circadian clock protein KaiC